MKNNVLIEKFKIEAMADSHLDEMVNIHIAAFPDFFLSFLGHRFLKTFYMSFINNENGIALVALDDNGRVVGGAAGPVSPASYFKKLLIRRWWVFCYSSVHAIIRRPAIVLRLFQAVFYRGEAPSSRKSMALLSSIAVAPETQGTGIGKALIRKWLDQARTANVEGAFLTTDAVDNDKVNAFYVNLGWVLESQYTTGHGRKMNRYVFNFK